MKSNNFLIIILFISFCAFISCENKVKSDIIHSDNGFGIPDTCYIYNHRTPDKSFQLRSICAKKYIDAYQIEVNLIMNGEIPSNADLLLSYGAGIASEEMEVITDHLRDSTYHEVYAMMAKVPGKSSDIIFVVKDTMLNKLAYFNFTYPCPEMCPY